MFKAFQETLDECIHFFELSCDFLIKCINIDRLPTIYDFSVSDFSWIPGRFSDIFKDSKHKRNFKNGNYS